MNDDTLESMNRFRRLTVIQERAYAADHTAGGNQRDWNIHGATTVSKCRVDESPTAHHKQVELVGRRRLVPPYDQKCLPILLVCQGKRP